MRKSIRLVALTALAIALQGCSSTGAVKSAASLYDQLGGASSISKLSGNFLSSAVSNPQLSSLLGNVDKVAAGSKLNDQLCSALGGSCKAPFSADQIKSAASKLSPGQTAALKDSFSSALGSSGVSSALQGPVNKALGSQLSGIIGGLL